MSSETTSRQQEHRSSTEPAVASGQEQKLGILDVWARSAPIRLAGFEDDLAEPHILPGVD